MTAESTCFQRRNAQLLEKVKQLRVKHILPAHIYGNTEPLNVEFDEKHS